MATYKPMQSIRLTADTTTVTFSGISQDYTDLEIVISARCSHSSNSNFYYRVNGDTSSSYSVTRLQGNGSTAVSNRGSSNTVGYIGYTDAADSSAGIFGNTKIYINNYSNSTTYKTLVSKGSTPGTSGYAAAFANLYRGSTSPITSISFTPDAGNWVAGSTFDIYGIKAGGSPQALGGDSVVSDGTYWYHTFLSSGAFTPYRNLTCDYLVVAGGGAGGYRIGGGGGAGGFRVSVSNSLAVGNYPVVVGAGGFAVTSLTGQGSNSSINSYVSTGGGYGATGDNGNTAGSGGSGGGGSHQTTGQAGGAGNTPSVSPSQGNNGGVGYAGGGPMAFPGGGGGAGSVGGNGNASQSGSGGSGTSTYNSINVSSWLSATGTGVGGVLAGGGGGGCNNSNGSPGSGGGAGAGNGGGNSSATSATANTGSGGGGQRNDATPSGRGGSGIVIVRYPV